MFCFTSFFFSFFFLFSPISSLFILVPIVARTVHGGKRVSRVKIVMVFQRSPAWNTRGLCWQGARLRNGHSLFNRQGTGLGAWLVYGSKRKPLTHWDGKRTYTRELEWCPLEIDRLTETIALVSNGKKKLLASICLSILPVFFIVAQSWMLIRCQLV